MAAMAAVGCVEWTLRWSDGSGSLVNVWFVIVCGIMAVVVVN